MESERVVNVWEETIRIPTYEVSEPEKFPVFLEKRVYQGSTGSVYPNPVIEKIADTKVEKSWDVIFMENQFIKIMVMPSLGGRIQMAYDKVKERHFVYYNEVIKPALVGLTGPWISGGIEFNWPQHHRPSTYEPVDYYIERHADGSATVWVSEIERMFRTKGMAGFTLYPDKAYIEVRGKLFNRTPQPQTFLWWANPAVAASDHYQSVFPEDVNAVFDHGKRDVSEFPIAKGTYYKVDYSQGVDISRYKNIPVPTSFMAVNSEYDFVGGYESDTQAGLLHVANHHISPGKKQWTWGDGDFGRAWDRNLTDKNGPYVELMCGVFTDNQPDFAWIEPYEEKEFTQYFMPYQKVGVVKNATKDALLNVEIANGTLRMMVYSPGIFERCTIKLWVKGNLLIDQRFDLSPRSVFDASMGYSGEAAEMKAEVKDSNNKLLVSWDTSKRVEKTLPESAKAPKAPSEIDSIEELFLTGLHIEQYRHATYRAVDYYREGLRRDDNDVRNNNALGRHLLQTGDFEQAAGHFQKAIDRLTKYNPNPSDGEPYFNKGIALKLMGKYDEAYAAFFKSAWNAAYKGAGYYNLALIEIRRGNFEYALELINTSLVHNWHNHKARHIKAVIQRKLASRDQEAFITESLSLDRFNFGLLYEKYLHTSDPEDRNSLKGLLRDYVHNYLEIALDYAEGGLYQEAVDFLQLYCSDRQSGYPMIYYFLGYFSEQLGKWEAAQTYYGLAASMPTDYCFPNRLEEVILLEHVTKTRPNDANALYYLGNFWMYRRSYDKARSCWEKSLSIGNRSALVLRNLALICFNKYDEKLLALAYLEEAFQREGDNPRLLMELDQLYIKLNKPKEFRWTFLESNLKAVLERDDVYLEYIKLLNLHGKHAEALRCLMDRKFHPWEGGEGKVPEQYVTSLLEMAKSNLHNGEIRKALEYLQMAQTYPENLGEGKLPISTDNDLYYWLGCAYQALGDEQEAKNAWQKAIQGPSEPSPAVYYNDQSPDKILYQGLAFQQLGQDNEARNRFDSLISYGKSHYNDEVKIDYFAVSLPDLLIWEENLNARNQIHCDYMIALGNLGLGNSEEANRYFNKILSRDPSHQGAHIHQRMIAYLQDGISR